MKHLLVFTVLLPAFIISFSGKENISVVFEETKTTTEAGLRALYVVDANVIWAGGSNGTVLRSIDGGNSWEVFEISGAEQNDFRSIHAWDAGKAIVFGVAGPDFGYKTNDAGKSWQVVFRDTTSGLFFNSVKFANELNGIAVSDPVEGKFFVIQTEDGGKSWARIIDIPGVFKGEANFAASNTCIEFLSSGRAWIASGGKVARVFSSHNFGKSWDVYETPMISGEADAGIFSVSFKNDLEGAIVGGRYNQPELNQNIAAYTENGGKTWFAAEKMPKEYRSCVQFVDAQKSFYFAVGKTGCDFSIDNGKNWQYLNSNGFYTFRQVPRKLEGFAAGANGRIAKVKFKITKK